MVLSLSRFISEVQTVAPSIPDGIIVSDIMMRIVFVSDSALLLNGFAPEDADHILGRNILDFIDDDSREAARKNIARLMASRGTFKESYILRKKDGEPYHCEINTSLICDDNGDSIALLSVIRDITDRINTEKALVAAKAAAEQASLFKSQYLANMSHEIRTPMNGVLGAVQILMLTPLSKEQNEYLLLLKRSADHMLALINDILDISRIEAGAIKITQRPVSIQQLVAELSQIIKVKAGEKGLSFTISVMDEVPAVILADPLRLEQILLNFLGNAVKYTDTGSVQLIISARQVLGDQSQYEFSFSVLDTGIGIESHSIPHLFDRFFQAESGYTKKRQGTGLGLPISQKLAELMGGTITVESELGKGSVFTFAAPFKKI